jgi:hypothetical protein
MRKYFGKSIVGKGFSGLLISLLAIFAFGVATPTTAQGKISQVKSQEVSDVDGVPVLIKHLPDWETVRTQAELLQNNSDLKTALSGRPVLDFVDFTAGTEAATAPYPAGKLLIIEYSSPQLSVEADNNFKNFLSQNGDGRTFYKRTGNYNIFVFDASDEAAATALIGQVKYEKNIQWLGEDPFLFHKIERAFVNQTTELFFSTVEVIGLGIVVSILTGLIVGFVYFQIRERQRQTFHEFSDAGGMIRLNLDGLTPDISSERLLNE